MASVNWFRRAAAALVLVASSAVAQADSWHEFPDQRVPSPNGEYYVVYDGGAWSYHRAKAGSPPVTPARTKPYSDEAVDTSARAGDRTLGSGGGQLPIETRVSNRGLGFVRLDTWYGTGRGVVITFVDGHGKVAFKRSMEELFTEDQIEGFFRTVSSISWLDTAWIDEETEELVVVPYEVEPFVLALGDGSRSEMTEAHVIRGLASPFDDAVQEAIGFVVTRRTEGVREVLRGIEADVRRSWVLRLAATEALRRRGEGGDSMLVRAVADPDSGVDEHTRKYALTLLPRYLGKDALPLLHEALRDESGTIWHAAQLGFAELGADAIPTLVKVLAAVDDETANTRGGACHALNEIGAESSLPALLRAVADREKYVANAALNAAIKIGGKDIAPELAAHLRTPTTQDGRLAMYFEDVRHAGAVQPLLIALRRNSDPDFATGRILDALRFQTGEDHGDREAWLRAYPEEE